MIIRTFNQHILFENYTRYFNASLLTESQLFEIETLEVKQTPEVKKVSITAFKRSLGSSSRAEFMTPYSLVELASMQLFLIDGLNAGFAIKTDGDIVLVHNNSGIKGLGPKLIELAVKNGGTKLDHFDGYLSQLYSKLGFVEVHRDKWDDQYAPKNWNYEKYGTPDVVYREYKG